MAETKNALAELAERLSSNKVELVEGDEFPIRLSREAVIDFRKARRIVEEVAKVEDRREGETNSDVLWRCNDCIAKCRVIAEEGDSK